MNEDLPKNILELIVYLEEQYPDRMVLEDIDTFTRGLEAGKVELIQWLRFNYIKEEE